MAKTPSPAQERSSCRALVRAQCRRRHRALGLNVNRDRLCLVQLSSGDGKRTSCSSTAATTPRPISRPADRPGRAQDLSLRAFDMAVLEKNLGVVTAPIYCTKIASKLVRTYTDRHGLKDLVGELVGIELSKQQQSSDWALSSFPSSSSPMRRQTCCTCMLSRPSSTPCWRARSDPSSPRPPSVSSHPRQARSGRLRRGRYLLALRLAAPCNSHAHVIGGQAST